VCCSHVAVASTVLHGRYKPCALLPVLDQHHQRYLSLRSHTTTTPLALLLN
jgi:hypothetical protein